MPKPFAQRNPILWTKKFRDNSTHNFDELPSFVEHPEFNTTRPFEKVSSDFLVCLDRYEASFKSASFTDSVVVMSESAYITLTPMDAIRINDLLLTVSLEVGARWAKPAVSVEQPISVSLSIFHDVSSAGRTDDLSFSLNYSSIAKCIRKRIAARSFSHLQDVSCQVSGALTDALDGRCLDGLRVGVRVLQIKSPLHTKSVGIEHLATFRADRLWAPSHVIHFIEGLSCDAIVGIHPHERVEKQDVVVNLAIESKAYGLVGDPVDFRLIIKTIYDVRRFFSLRLRAVQLLLSRKSLPPAIRLSRR